MNVIDGPFLRGRLVQISASPRIYVMDGFVGDDEIESIKAVGDAVEQLEACGFEISRGPAGRAADLPALDETFAAVTARIEALVGAEDMLDGSMRFRRYAVGEFHRRHTDAVYPVEGLHLLVTTLVCLDEPDAGGETLFPYAEAGPLAVRHRRGRLVMWCNYLPDGAVDRTAIHEGLPVLAGTKATIGKFLHRPLAEAPLEPRAAFAASAAASLDARV